MENENEKAESSVTGYGNPSLDADPIDESTENQIDALLDAAQAELNQSTQRNPSKRKKLNQSRNQSKGLLNPRNRQRLQKHL